MRSVVKWRITRIRSNRAGQLGTVEAPDAKAAIKVAIKKYDLTEEHEQKRIAAWQERSSPPSNVTLPLPAANAEACSKTSLRRQSKVNSQTHNALKAISSKGAEKKGAGRRGMVDH
jgi:hypothetical protein